MLKKQIQAFKRPYNFPVVIAFFLGCFSLAATLIFSFLAIPFLETRLLFNFNSPRLVYFLYLLFLSTIAILASTKAKLAAGLLLLFGLEFTLGIGLAIAQRAGIPITSLLPSNFIENRFDYHPLLVGLPKANFLSTDPYRIVHNNFHQRAVETSSTTGPIDVAVFGGSSTYDVSIPNPHTWVELVARALGNNYRFSNNGVPGYGSAEHVIQTAFYLERGLDRTPDCALYYLGWNDIRNIGLEDTDGGFANYHLLSQYNNLRTRTPGFNSFSPVLTLVTRLFSVALSPIPQVKKYNKDDTITITDNDLIASKSMEYSMRNIKSIIAMNSSREVKSIFIPQLFDPSRVTANTSYGWIPRIKDQDISRIQQFFNARLRNVARRSGAAVIDIDAGKFNADDFADQVHFSKAGAIKFSRLITDSIRNECTNIH